MIREIYTEWEACRDSMLPAIEQCKGTHTEDDILARLFTGQLKLWRKNKTGLVTDFCQYPQMKTINVFLAGGKLEEQLILQGQIENFGRKNGCARATMLAVREGYARVVPGAVADGTYLWKDL